MLRRQMPLRLIPLLVILGAAGALQAATINLSPVADTTLFQTRPNNNLGAEPTFVCGSTAAGFTNRALLKFDIAGQIPSNAIIQTVALTVTVTRTTALQESSFSLHRTLRDWGEGAGESTNGMAGGNVGAQATNGEATWLARFYPDVLWSAPGAVAPVDYLDGASATEAIGAAGSYTFSSSSNLVLDAQNWLTNPTNNFGWILICADEASAGSARRFGSREDAANAPTLQVGYVIPPTINRTEIVGNQFNLYFVAQTNQAYVVQSRGSLSSGSWVTFTNLPPPSSVQTVVVSAPVTGSQAFYRVGVQ